MKSTIAIINSYPKFDAVFEPVAGEMNMAVKRYAGIRTMADDLNSKSLPVDELALIIVTGTSEEQDAVQYRRNMNLLEQFARHSKLKSVPVLFLGYRGDIELGNACDDCGAAYLDLPVKKSELMGKIRELCGQDRAGLTPRPSLSAGEGEFSKKSSDSKPLSYKERGEAKPGVRSESERRLATVMFADISGFTAMSEKMDPEEVTAIMNGCFEMLGGCIKMHGGTIDKFIGDCVMVCFGVPAALENAPLSAVNTAISIRNSLHEFNRRKNLAVPLDIHIGINTGTVIAGTVGTADKKDYTVMGDAVNLASRIEGAAEKGQILVGPDTYRATQDEFQFRALAPVSLKGKAEPVPVYELMSVREALPQRQAAVAPKPGGDRMIYSELVGRDEEMNMLRHLVTGLVAGKGGIVTVSGEAGIGKSRLMAEMKADPSMKGVLLLEGRALSMGRTLSFHPIIEIFKNWSGITDDDGEAAQISKLEKAIRAVHPAEADEIVPFVATLMGMKLSGKFAERVKGIEGEALEKLIFKNMRELMLKGSEQRPLIFYIEDLHWADTSSIELLSSLFRLTERNRILFMLVFRPNYEETSDRILKTLASDFPDRYVSIVIEPLSETETAALIGNLLNIKGLPRQIEDQIKERAGGNPFFIEEVVRSFIDEGAVVKKGDTFQVTEKIHNVTVPLTINEVLMSRIDRLDEETRNLVKIAAVIGRNFFHKIITQVAGSVSEIEKRLSYLEDIQLIRERKRMDELEYLFKHALAQEAAYESLLLQRRRELHLYVAQAIESVFNERLHEFYGMLAYHYGKGDNLDKAEEFMLRAGEEAMKSSASSEALDYFTRSLELYRDKYGDRVDPVKIAALEKNIAMAYHNRGEYSRAVDYFTMVLAFHGVTFPQNPLLRNLNFIQSFCNLLIGLYVPFFKWKKTPDKKDMEYFYLVERRGMALSHTDPHRFFIESFSLARRFTKMDISNNEYLLGIAVLMSTLFSWPSISYNLSNRCIFFCKKFIKPHHELPNLLVPYLTDIKEFMVGDWHNEKFNEALVKSYLDRGDVFYIDNYSIMSAFWHLETGDVATAKHIVAMLHDIGETYDNMQTRGFSIILDMRIIMKVRRFQDLLDMYDGSMEFFDRIGEKTLHFEAHTFKARALLLGGDIAGASECLEYLDQLAREMELIPFYASDFRIARFMFDMHMLEDGVVTGNMLRIRKYRRMAMESGKEALKISRKLKRDRTEALKLMGTYYWIIGKPKKALLWWKKSIGLGERLKAKLELSRTYFEAGKRALTPWPPLPGGEGDFGIRRFTPEPSPSGRGRGRAGVRAETVKKILGLTPEQCLDKAEAMFKDMDLQWDLEQLEKVRSEVRV